MHASSTSSSATSSRHHQTVPLLIIPTPGGGTKLQPLTPEQVISSTGLVVDPLFPPPPSTNSTPQVAPRIPPTSRSPALPKCDSAASSSDGDAANPVNLDYVINESDGSCMCKMCGEVLSSRTHWYRHKYKVPNGSIPLLGRTVSFSCHMARMALQSQKN